MYKELNKEIKDFKNDLFYNKIEKSDVKYHKWIKENIKFLYPKKIEKNIAYDVKIHTNKYIVYSFYINAKIEKLENIADASNEFFTIRP